MSWVDRVERWLRPVAIPNLTLLIVIAQATGFAIVQGREDLAAGMPLIGEKVLAGEWWRLITFLFTPPSTNPFFAFFALYLLYLMGTALERRWGIARYNLYVWIACAATAAVAFLVPDQPVTNLFIDTSVFLAFAYLYPNFQLYLFFVLPVRVRWLALITWVFYGYMFAVGTGALRATIAASVLNFLVFFGQDIAVRAGSARRRMERDAQLATRRARAFHRCATCGATDRTHPTMDFRYCPGCGEGFCAEHIGDHACDAAGPREPGRA